ncbi:hypothetical protein D3C86_935910 [compost metagenome]
MTVFMRIHSILLAFYLAFGQYYASYAVNLTGIGGLVKIPTAVALDEGEMVVGFSWVGGSRGYLYQPKTNRHYFVSMGLLPGLELSLDQLQVIGWYPGDAPGVAYGFHRLWNVKYVIPLSKDWPKVAIGVQDPVGVNFLARAGAGKTEYGLNTLYGVLTQPMGSVSVHLGVGESPRFIQGFFFGADWAIGDAIRLELEQDSQDWNAGISWRPWRFLSLHIARLFPDDWAYSAALSLRL